MSMNHNLTIQIHQFPNRPQSFRLLVSFRYFCQDQMVTKYYSVKKFIHIYHHVFLNRGLNYHHSRQVEHLTKKQCRQGVWFHFILVIKAGGLKVLGANHNLLVVLTFTLKKKLSMLPLHNGSIKAKNLTPFIVPILKNGRIRKPRISSQKNYGQSLINNCVIIQL